MPVLLVTGVTMNRRILIFIILINMFVSLAISVTVVWLAEQRQPSLEELVVRFTPPPPLVLVATPTAADRQASQQEVVPQTSSAATPAQPDTGETEIYEVEPGDTLLLIAGRFGITLDELMQANNLTDPDFVFSGQRLVIPVSQTDIRASVGNSSIATSNALQLRIENAGDLATEAVQVVNDSDIAVNLQGWTISRDGGPIYTFGSVPLFPGSGIRLYTGNGQDNSLNRYWGLSAPVWADSSTAILRNPDSTRIADTETP